MHVNHEARYIARRRIKLIKSRTARCMVPARRFRPELDALYIPWEAWRSFSLLEEYYGVIWLENIEHVAVDMCLSTNLVAFFRKVHCIAGVRTIRFVLASKDGHSNSNSIVILHSPVARYVLQSFPTGKGPLDDGNETTDAGRRISLYLDHVNSVALEAATTAMEAAESNENHFVIELLIQGGTLDIAISASILMKYHHELKGSKGPGFVEMGRDNVANLSFPIR